MCGIVDGKKKFVTYREWATLIQSSFERYYYIPLGKSPLLAVGSMSDL